MGVRRWDVRRRSGCFHVEYVRTVETDARFVSVANHRCFMSKEACKEKENTVGKTERKDR